MSKLHLFHPGTVAPRCGTRAPDGHDLPKGTEDLAKFQRIAGNPEATFSACGRCVSIGLKVKP